MIKVNDIRIGNLITYKNRANGDTQMPVEVGDLFRIEQEPNGYDPIPLTEEWILKFGFDFVSNRSLWKLFNCPFYIEYIIAQYRILIRGVTQSVECSEFPELKYVHQLQNLFHALTGQELTIKP